MSAREPFPWSALDRYTGEQARALGRARRQIAPHVATAALAEGCARLLGRPLELEVVETWAGDDLAPPAAHLGVPLALGGDEAGLVLYVENALALRLAALVVGHPLAWGDARRPLAPEIAGAAAAFLTAAARLTGRPWRLAGPAPPKGPFVVVRAVALLGEEVFNALAAVPLAPLPPPPAPFDRHALAALGDVPLSLPLVAAVGGATDEELAALTPGAAWAPGDGWTLRPDGAGRWQGRALLVAPRAEVGLEARYEGAGLRLAAGSVPCPWGPEDEDDGGVALRPVRVEVGRVTMAARAWAALGPGEPLSAPTWGPVTVRVGGEAVARGRVGRVGADEAVLLTETFGGRV